MKEFKRYSGVILKHNDEVLLCKRSPEESLPNQWSLPSGHIEGKESPMEAAVREFKEETNIKLPSKLDLIGFINRYQKDGVTKKGMMYVFYFNSEKKLQPNLEKAKDGHEHTKCQYFTKKNLDITKENDQLLKLIQKVLK